MSKKKMSEVRRLIGERDFESAKKILQTINHPKARELEARVDKVLAKRPQSGTRKPSTQRSVATKSAGSSLGRRLMFFMGGMVIIALIVLAVVFVSTRSDDDSQTNTVADVTDEANTNDAESDNSDDNDAGNNTNTNETNDDNGSNDDLPQLDRSDPEAVAERVIRAVFAGDEDTVLSLVCDADLQNIDESALGAYGLGLTASLPGGTIDASGINVDSVSVNGDIATVTFSGEVVITMDGVGDGVPPVPVEIEPNTIELQNTNDEWGFCSQ